MDTAFVIGGAGFVGQHLVRHLVAHGFFVYATHRPGSPPPDVPGVNWIAADLANPDPSQGWPTRPQNIIYLAQSAKWRDFPATSEDILQVNVSALNLVAMYGRCMSAKRFVHMSSGTVYAQTREPAREDEAIPVGAARSFYGATKLAAELLLNPYSAFFGVTQLRLFMPYGPGQNEKMLLPQIVSKVRAGTSIDLHGEEGLRCNPIAVADVAEAVRRCLTLDGSQTLNLAGPEVLTLRQVAEAVGTAVGREPRFNSKPETPPVIAGETSRLKAALGWHPPTRFADGVREWLDSKN
jgi:nucleoside-diphosphate-sugar epimerase